MRNGMTSDQNNPTGDFLSGEQRLGTFSATFPTFPTKNQVCWWCHRQEGWTDPDQNHPRGVVSFKGTPGFSPMRILAHLQLFGKSRDVGCPFGQRSYFCPTGFRALLTHSSFSGRST